MGPRSRRSAPVSLDVDLNGGRGSSRALPAEVLLACGPYSGAPAIQRRRTTPGTAVCSLLLVSLAACVGCRALYTRTFEPEVLPRTKGLAAQKVDEVLALPEEEIDIGRAALLVVREDRPELDLDACLRRLDEIAARLRRRLPEGTPVAQAVRETVSVVQPKIRTESRPGRARRRQEARGPVPPAPVSEAPPGGLPSKIDLARILEGAEGNCLGLTILYLAVAERVGMPLYGVSMPEHFFVRYDDGVTRVNIEPTRGGRTVPDRSYIRSGYGARVSRDSMERGIHMRSESKRQVIASLLANRAGYRAMQGDLDAASDDALRALAVKPYWPQAYVNRGLAREFAGRTQEAVSDYRRALGLDPYCVGALNNLAALYCRGRAVGAEAPPDSLRRDDPRADLTPGSEPRIVDPHSGDLASAGVGSGYPGDVPPVQALGSAETAEWMIRRAIALAPTRPELYETAAAVAAAQGKWRQARARLLRARALAPGNGRYGKLMRALEGRMQGPGDPRVPAD